MSVLFARRRIFALVSFLITILLAGVMPLVVAAPSAPTLINLGSLTVDATGYLFDTRSLKSNGLAINDSGEVAGWGESYDFNESFGFSRDTHAFVRSPGDSSMRDLGLHEVDATTPMFINRVGQVVLKKYGGWVLFTPNAPNGNVGQVSALQPLEVRGLNNFGQVVGEIPGSAASRSQAAVWTPDAANGATGHLVILGDGTAVGINDAGQIAGQLDSTLSSIQTLWTPSTANGTTFQTALFNDPSLERFWAINATGQIAVTTVTGGVGLWTPDTANGTHGQLAIVGETTAPTIAALNSRGQIVGTAVNHAFLADGTGLHDLQILSGYASAIRFTSSATAVNGLGQVVGLLFCESNCTSSIPSQQAFLADVIGMTPLSTLGGPTSKAAAINDDGRIAGSGDTLFSSTSIVPRAFTTGSLAEPPSITAPSGFVTEATSPAGAAVTFEVSANDAVDGVLPATATPASGSMFRLGLTQVLVTATNSHGVTASLSFPVQVRDTTPPAITVPGTITVNPSGPSGAAVSFGVSATDLVDGSVAVTADPASGSTFPIGTTAVLVAATDTHGNRATKTFNIVVSDVAHPPVITTPGDVTAEATSASGAPVTFSVSATSATANPVTVTGSPASGSTFPLGDTIVTVTATDHDGLTATATFRVTVRDTTPPAITVPGTITAGATGPSGAPVTFSASATDLVDGAVAVTTDPASGSTFPIGTTSVVASATDAHGNKATRSFNVVVVPPPVITTPGNLTAEAAGPSGALVTFSVSATSATAGPVSVTASPASGSTFPLGDTTVTVTATDSGGRAATATFSVTVRDTTRPSLIVSTPITVETPSPAGATVAIAAQATDLVDGTITPVCTPASGSLFPVGTTEVSCSATDRAGNRAVAPAVVIVKLRMISAVSITCPTTALTYLGAPQTPCTATVSSAADGFSAALTVSYTNNTNAGTATASASWPGDVTHVGSSGLATFTIAPAPLTVAAENKTKLFGAADPPLTYQVTGLRGADTLAGVLTGALSRDLGEQVGIYMIRQGSLAANGNYRVNFTVGSLSITFNTCLLYNPGKPTKSGATIPIKLQLCSATGVNVSDASIILTADQLSLVTTSATFRINDAGHANPDNKFRFEKGEGDEEEKEGKDDDEDEDKEEKDGEGARYIFNLKTTGLAAGTYALRVRATNDPAPHLLLFQVRLRTEDRRP